MDKFLSSEKEFGRQSLISRLRQYLGDLNPEAHSTLTRSIDRARARGEHSPVHDMIMEALRDVVAVRSEPVERVVSAERAFFEPIGPILGSVHLPEKQTGIIDRASLRPMWIWITRDLAPGRCDGELAALRAAIVDEDKDAVDETAEEFQAAVCKHARALIDEYDKKHGTLQKLEAQLGTSRVMADLHDLLAFFDQREPFEAFLEQLPRKLPVGEAGLKVLDKALMAYKSAPTSATIYAFSACVDRLGSSSDLVRFAVHHANSSDPAAIRATMASGAIQIALSQAMQEAELLRLSLAQDRRVDKVTPILHRYHELVSAIGRTLDDVPSDPWQKRLSSIRARASDLLAKELEPLLAIIKRSIGVMESRGKEIVPDASGVEEAVFGLTVLMIARDARRSLAINALIERLEKGIEDALESQGKPAIDRLTTVCDENWEAAMARSAAAVRLFGIYFGGVYGASLARRHSATIEARLAKKAS